ncbi:MAG: TIGR02186 family protein [Hyphococcus sp.]
MKHVLAALGFLFAAPASAADIAIALTDDFIRVDTGFAGARLVLFGAVSGLDNPGENVDIISVVRGPDTRYEIRQLEKRNLIWMPGRSHVIEGAPGLYLTTATKPVADIAPLPDQAAYGLGADYLDIAALNEVINAAGEQAGGPESARMDAAEKTLFEKAFLNEIEDQGLYRDVVGGVEFKKGGLFTIDVNLPANTPVGDYEISVFLYRNGVLLGRDSAMLAVNKVGVERRIYELAHGRPVSYGVACVALSLLAGWLAGLAFRK